MEVTVSRDTEAVAERRAVRLFLTMRPARTALAVTVALGVLTAWSGLVEASLPTAVERGTTTISLWRMLAMGAAVLPVLALTSPLADLEVVATRRLRSMQRYLLAGLGIGSAVIYLGLSALAMPPSVVGIIARSWLAWFGLALLAGAVLGWRLAWTLPSAVAVVLWYWGYQGDQRYQWWEFSARPHDDPPTLLLSFALLTVGLIAYAATPWRRRRWSFQRLLAGHRLKRTGLDG